MEIRISKPTSGSPLPPIEWNYSEVKAWLEAGLADYKGRIYTAATISSAKSDRANLNKLAEAIDAKRKEMKAMYLKPYEEFEAQAKELTAMVKEVSAAIDAQVKAFDAIRKEEKLQKIKETIYEPLVGNLKELVPYDSIHNPKWLNVTVSLGAVAEEVAKVIGRIDAGLKAIDNLNLDDDIALQVKDAFLKNYDLAAAVTVKDKLIRQRAELARVKAEQTPAKPEHTAQKPEHQPGNGLPEQADEPIYTVVFRIKVTAAQLKNLGEYMRANGIQPERVKN